MDFVTIISTIGALVMGSGGIWAVWAFLKPRLPANPTRDKVIEEILRQMNKQTLPPDGPSVPDRATALQYCEAILRFMEKTGSKTGVEYLVKVMSEIASPSVPAPVKE
jgi:hypothetical protein